LPALRNDDRPLTVSDITVNEGSPYAVFTITGAANQYVQLTMSEGTAKRDANGTQVLDGSEDFGPLFEYFNGSSWVAYNAGDFVQIPSAGTSLLVRTVVVNDTNYEMSESFTLTAVNTGGTGDVGTGTIKDDGTGLWFAGTSGTGSATAPSGSSLNDDRPKNPAFVNDLLVNEGSGQITLALANGTALAGSDYGNALEYWNGSTWAAYSSGSLPSLDSNGNLKVRIPILADTLSDGGERFQLSVQYTGVKDAGQTLIPDTTTVFNGFAMIMDDGTGFMWDSNGNLLTPASSAVVPSGNLLTSPTPWSIGTAHSGPPTLQTPS
jgi:hypothetical protein